MLKQLINNYIISFPFYYSEVEMASTVYKLLALMCCIAIATSASIAPVTIRHKNVTIATINANNTTPHSSHDGDAHHTTTSHDPHHGNQSCEGSGGHHEGQGHDEGHHASDRIHVVELNFEHVKGPLIVLVIVIFAGLSKIGMYCITVNEM